MPRHDCREGQFRRRELLGIKNARMQSVLGVAERAYGGVLVDRQITGIARRKCGQRFVRILFFNPSTTLNSNLPQSRK